MRPYSFWFSLQDKTYLEFLSFFLSMLFGFPRYDNSRIQVLHDRKERWMLLCMKRTVTDGFCNMEKLHRHRISVLQ